MGTKRHLANHVRNAIAELHPTGRVIDLFSGMGSVAESLQYTSHVVTNDALSFTAVLSRARFTGPKRTATASDFLSRLLPAYETRYSELIKEFREQLRAERLSLRGDKESLSDYISRARHVGNDRGRAFRAMKAETAVGSAHYSLASLYFSAGYLSLAQAIEVDSLRFAIDSELSLGTGEKDWLLGAWLMAMSGTLNAPGHTAQFLKPNTETGFSRISRAWEKSIWHCFGEALSVLQQVGSEKWRFGNDVYVGDALQLIGSDQLQNIGAVYADPPYTKDQYSRFYHVYETMYRYDYPDSSGAGRNRSDRFSTGFSLKTAVVASFHDLCRQVAKRRVPLILSYPSQGLLRETGWTFENIAKQYFSAIKTFSFETNHSTMGASSGSSKKKATENIYVCSS